MSKHIESAREHLRAAHTHVDSALEAHEAGRDSTVRRHLRGASDSLDLLDAALRRAAQEQHDATANPTAAMGAQVSNGQSPRAYDAEARRQRDQLAGCELGYRARLGLLGARR